MTNVNNDFKFTFSANHKAELIAYVERIIETTKAQVQAKRRTILNELIAFEMNYGTITDKDKQLAQEGADAIFEDTLANRDLRMQIVEDLTECYREAAGDWPDAKTLEKLTDAILCEELTDMHPDKITRTEYPFMSDWQLDARHENEYADTLGEAHGTDGRKHSKPTRRVRTGREHFVVNKHTKSRNLERKRKYREFTKVQPVTTRWITEDGELSDVKPEVAE
jgi:hypothetical protein